jgi:hypothetical protein
MILERIFELFNWNITKFLAVRWLRSVYWGVVWLTVLLVAIIEWYIGQSDSFKHSDKVLLGIAVILVAIILLLSVRVLIEFLISIFYIESHLRQIANRGQEFEIPD